MIAPAILAAAVAAVSAPPAEDDRILVMAERLRAIDVSVGQDSAGKWHCSLSASSGRGSIDGRLCRATTQCVRKHGDDREAISSCVDSLRGGIVEDFLRLARGGHA